MLKSINSYLLLLVVFISISWGSITFNNSFIFDGYAPSPSEIISDVPELSILVTSNTSSVSFNAFLLYVDGVNILTKSPYNYSYTPYTSEFKYKFTNSLYVGSHTFQLYALDSGGGATSQVRSYFVKSNKFKLLDDPIIIPSPATKNVRITYNLSRSNDIEIYIYDLNGQIVFTNTYNSGAEGGRGGYNSVNFNLTSSYGNDLPNGVYIVMIIQNDSGTKKLLGKRKFMILRDKV